MSGRALRRKNQRRLKGVQQGRRGAMRGLAVKQLKRAYSAIRAHGLLGVVRIVIQRTVALEALIFRRNRERFMDKVGLELGGPSSLFLRRHALPVYALAARIDNVNYAARTTWESVEEGLTFRFDESQPPGRQFVGEATDLSYIPAGVYDFVLSSHMLEHTANPLKVMAELRRVLKPMGTFLLVLPDPRRTFDHRRPVTTLSHLVQDFERGTGEDDLTHLPEILELHDLAEDRDAPQEPLEFRDRCLRNPSLRCMHHHVFDKALIRAMLERSGFRVVDFTARSPHELICLGERFENSV
jgi:SAM-dependent methyltransferase